MKKETLYKTISVLLPFALLLFVEVVLRLAGYGESYRLFLTYRTENRQEYFVMNPKVSGKYFGNNGYKSDNQSDIFLRKKTDDTFRVFVMGASTVVGFPYYGSGSFPRMPKHRLAQTFPEKNIEVVNTGMTAVNTYTLLDLAGEIIQKEPDAVIIYAGHNEYYGALGVGSSSSYGNRPAFVRASLALKKLRLFQWLGNTYAKASKLLPIS